VGYTFHKGLAVPTLLCESGIWVKNKHEIFKLEIVSE